MESAPAEGWPFDGELWGEKGVADHIVFQIVSAAIRQAKTFRSVSW
jgi:hypothetical protein